MCEECGCDKQSETREIILNKSISEKNDSLAKEIKNNLRKKGILCINVLGAPGCGKTTFIEVVSQILNHSSIAVIQGDLESDIDKQRLDKQEIYAYQINTHSGCHLNSYMIHNALEDMNLKGKKYLIIENVGNLVCPAGIKIGQHINIVISSTTEGSDKPKKYPFIFMDANVILISKFDLADKVEFNEKNYIKDIRKINSNAKIIKISLKDKKTFLKVARFIEDERNYLITRNHSH